MAHRPTLSHYPLVPRDYNVSNPIRGELLMDYTYNDLYYVKPSTGEVVSIAREIYDRILAARIQNTNIVIYNRDKLIPKPDKDAVTPPVIDRKFNTFYAIVNSRKTTTDADNAMVLTAIASMVKKGVTFYGKTSNYSPSSK